MKLTRRALLAIGLLVGLCASITFLDAQTPEEQAQPPEVAATATAADPEELSPEEKKRRAVEQRIADYLEAKERRRLEAEARAAAPDSQPQAAPVATSAAAPALAPPPKAASQKPAGSRKDYPALPADLQRAQDVVRQSHLSKDPTIQYYLDLIQRSGASPEELAAFGNFLADSGMNQVALPYYEVAVKLAPQDPLLWNNLGTIYRQIGEWDKAKQAYSRSLALNPTNGMAHYNLGALYDLQRKYDAALKEYRIALTIDPDLGDPELNPSAANNERLLAVQLMIYQDRAGNVGLPLLPMGEPIVLAPLEEDAEK